MQLTQKYLKSILKYNPDTGIFTYRHTSSRGVSGDRAGSKDSRGYRSIQIDDKLYLEHRLAFLYIAGYFPENSIDHINRCPNDNRWDNLREVSHLCNMRNRKMLKNNKSGITGVSWNNINKNWTACIKADRHIFLGSFDNKLSAAKARWEAEKKYGFPNCNTTSSALEYIKLHSKDNSQPVRDVLCTTLNEIIGDLQLIKKTDFNFSENDEFIIGKVEGIEDAIKIIEQKLKRL